MSGTTSTGTWSTSESMTGGSSTAPSPLKRLAPCLTFAFPSYFLSIRKFLGSFHPTKCPGDQKFDYPKVTYSRELTDMARRCLSKGLIRQLDLLTRQIYAEMIKQLFCRNRQHHSCILEQMIFCKTHNKSYILSLF